MRRILLKSAKENGTMLHQRQPKVAVLRLEKERDELKSKIEEFEALIAKRDDEDRVKDREILKLERKWTVIVDEIESRL